MNGANEDRSLGRWWDYWVCLFISCLGVVYLALMDFGIIGSSVAVGGAIAAIPVYFLIYKVRVPLARIDERVRTIEQALPHWTKGIELLTRIDERVKTIEQALPDWTKGIELLARIDERVKTLERDVSTLRGFAPPGGAG